MRPTQNQKAFSVLITTYNRVNTLHQNLLLLNEQEYPKNKVELVVVMDGCTDRTQPMLADITSKLDCQLTVLSLPPEEPKTFRFSQAHNLGLEACKNPYVLFLDDDALPPLHMLKTHASLHDTVESVYETDAVVIGATMQGADFRRLTDYSLTQFAKADPYYRYCVQNRLNLPSRNFVTNNTSVKKEYVSQVGGFKETTDYWAAIDNELGVRLKTKFPNLRFVFAHNSVTAHGVIHPQDFLSARVLNPEKMSPDVRKMMQDKNKAFKRHLGIENAFPDA